MPNLMRNVDLPPKVRLPTRLVRPAFARARASRRAIAEFQLLRSCVLLWVLFAAVVLSRTHVAASDARFALGLCGLALAIVVELIGRARLVSVLRREARGHGQTAQLERVLGEILSESMPLSSAHHGAGAPPILITEQDSTRICDAVSNAPFVHEAALGALERELSRAHIVSARSVPADVVTMRSRVRFADDAGEQREVTLVYPSEAEADDSCVSVLSPIGSALLGLRAGQAIEWAFPEGVTKRLRVLAVLYQPEASGHFHR